MKNWMVRGLVPVTIALGAMLCTGALMMSRTSRAEKAAEQPTLASLRVAGVERGPVELTLSAVGEVSAVHDVALLSEVSGTLSWVDSEVHAGMRVSKGQVVARLDTTSFDADVAAAEATLASAEEALALELGSGHVAALEARLVGPIEGSDPALLRRDPQRATAEANVASAKAALVHAKRQRALTSIRAPFDALLAEESLDVGRLVTSSTQLGRWVGTSAAEIGVPIPSTALQWFADGAVSAEVHPQGAEPGQVRQADSVGATGVVDATTRTARVMVRVAAPYDTSEGPALLPGSFVEVTLRGVTIDDASRLPVEALVDGSAVWSVSAESTLQRVPVQVVWRAGDEVIIQGVDGVQSVVARPSGTLHEGQAVRVREEG